MEKINVEVNLCGVEELLRAWVLMERRRLWKIRRSAREGLDVKQEVEDFRLNISDIIRVSSGHPLLERIKTEAEELEEKITEIPIFRRIR